MQFNPFRILCAVFGCWGLIVILIAPFAPNRELISGMLPVALVSMVAGLWAIWPMIKTIWDPFGETREEKKLREQRRLRNSERRAQREQQEWEREEARIEKEEARKEQKRKKQESGLKTIDAPSGDEPGYVYFILSDGSDMLKIGYAEDPNRRIKQLQTGSPAILRFVLVIPGSRDTEATLHERFATQRRNGEWFQIDDAISNFVNSRSQEAGYNGLNQYLISEAQQSKH